MSNYKTTNILPLNSFIIEYRNVMVSIQLTPPESQRPIKRLNTSLNNGDFSGMFTLSMSILRDADSGDSPTTF